MALRLYTKEEFEVELRARLGLVQTGKMTATTEAWKMKDGKAVLVPTRGVNIPDLGERFPDSYFATIYEQIERLNGS